MEFHVKRIYEPREPADGYRVLVDRLWPRGVSKDRAELDAWMKELTPSSELRRWFDHEASRWEEFKRRYSLELDIHDDLVTEISVAASSAVKSDKTLGIAHDSANRTASMLSDTQPNTACCWPIQHRARSIADVCQLGALPTALVG